MSEAKDIGLVLTDYITIYNFFEKPISYEEGVYNMNGGQCALVASVCGYIIKTKFGIKDLNICSNALHVYLNYKGKDYDTLFPEGYPSGATKGWLLEEVGMPTKVSCDPVGKEVNKGYWDWGFVYIFKSLCERWDVPLPPYFDYYVAGTERFSTTNDILKRKKQMVSLYTKSLSIPLPKSVKTNTVLPFTHYERVETEDTKSERELTPILFRLMNTISKG